MDETEKWYKYNEHDVGACGMLFDRKIGEYCPNHQCENHTPIHVGGYTDCAYCKNENRFKEEIYDESNCEGDHTIEPIIQKKVKKKKMLWITIKPSDKAKSEGGHTELTFINKVLRRGMECSYIKSGWFAFEWGG